MEPVMEKIGRNAKEFRQMDFQKRYELLQEVFHTIYDELPKEDRVQIDRIINSLIFKETGANNSRIRNFGKESILQAIGMLGIFLAGMSDDAIEDVCAKHRARYQAKWGLD